MKRIAVLAALLACKDTPPQPSVPASTQQPPPQAQEESVPHQVKTDMPPAAEIAALVRANNHFALELWAHAGAGNTAMSPVSISTALAMAWAGAKGTTADQMRQTMHLEGATDLLVSQWARISFALQDDTQPLTLKMANRVYGDARYQFDTTYFTITRKAFNAPLEMIDFRADPEAARVKINTWVAEQTAQRIKDLIPPRVLDASTSLVLVNAIYFLSDWAAQFDQALTRDEPFLVGGTKQQRVPTMHRQGDYRLAAGTGAALLELPYKGDRAAMYVLLPDRPDGLPALERDLAATLKTLQSKLANATVAVSLPRFTIDPAAPLQLAKALQALGMTHAFDAAKADFTGIAKADAGNPLYIGEVLHKAFVKVDERGTEAAAATAVMMPRGAPPRATPFKADHPFLFLIVDRGSGLILFIGRVVEPNS